MPRQIRPVAISGEIAEVPLTRGYVAIIDAQDVPLVSGHNWSALVSKKRGAVYAARGGSINGKKAMILMHRLISDAPNGLLVDHIDGDGLNNRRSNLRLCTAAENTLNVGLRRDSVSGYRGVSWDSGKNRWRAEIACGGKTTYLGLHATKEAAAAAYREASKALHGEFARAT